MTPAVVSNNQIANLGRRIRSSRQPKGLRGARLGWAMLVGLGLTGCPTAAELDTPYEEYEPIPTTVTATTVTVNTVTSSTTSGPAGCDDSTVNEVMEYWCGSSTCH